MIDSEFAQALQSLGSHLTAGDISRGTYCESLVRLLHGRLRPSRVNVWRLDEPETGERGPQVLERVAEYDPSPTGVPGRGVLQEAEFAPYLTLLGKHGIYASSDTLNDPALLPMRASYLVPSDVRALMDAAIAVNGRTVGVVCCEQIGAPRVWKRSELTAMLRTMATVNIHVARLRDRPARSGDPFV